MSAPTPASIAVLICSARRPRFCPQVATFVKTVIEALPLVEGRVPPSSLHLIDLADWQLPFMDEPNIPSTIKDSSDYVHAHTRAWSDEIQKHEAFIFVTPQYNWGYTAVSKNAIDFLFNEWVGKSSMIVSYGGHGGGKASASLRIVLNGVRMNVADTMPALHFGSKEVTARVSQAADMHLLDEDSMWASQRGEIGEAFQELMALVTKRREQEMNA